MEATNKLMNQHERVMKATKEMMSEHRRLKELLLEAQMMQQAGQDKATPKEPEEAKAVDSALASDQLCVGYLRFDCCRYYSGIFVAPQNALSQYSLYIGFAHLAAGLCCGLSGLAAGMAIGIFGDASVPTVGQQEKLFVGVILILIFAEALVHYATKQMKVLMKVKSEL
jgi:F0F1-type ATP synthase membrane subunit c/vacuolar-type H+-ATPase subunit K